jgi:hypothetical protein
MHAAQPCELLAAIGVQIQATLDARGLQNRHNRIERRDRKGNERSVLIVQYLMRSFY